MSEITRAQWETDCAAELTHAHENDVFGSFAAFAQVLGFSQISIAIMVPASMSQPVVGYWSNFDVSTTSSGKPLWIERFVERHKRHHGAKVAQGKRKATPSPGANPLYWSLCDFYREAAAYNVEFQIEKAIDAGYGSMVLVGFAGHVGVISAEARDRAHILIDQASRAMTKLLLAKYLPQHAVTLTELQRQYLCYVFDGYQNDDIADLIGITVNGGRNQQRELTELLQRDSIHGAAALAYRLGLLDAPIEPWDYPPAPGRH